VRATWNDRNNQDPDTSSFENFQPQIHFRIYGFVGVLRRHSYLVPSVLIFDKGNIHGDSKFRILMNGDVPSSLCTSTYYISNVTPWVSSTKKEPRQSPPPIRQLEQVAEYHHTIKFRHRGPCEHHATLPVDNRMQRDKCFFSRDTHSADETSREQRIPQ